MWISCKIENQAISHKNQNFHTVLKNQSILQPWAANPSWYQSAGAEIWLPSFDQAPATWSVTSSATLLSYTGLTSFIYFICLEFMILATDLQTLVGVKMSVHNRGAVYWWRARMVGFCSEKEFPSSVWMVLSWKFVNGEALIFMKYEYVAA